MFMYVVWREVWLMSVREVAAEIARIHPAIVMVQPYGVVAIPPIAGC